MTVTTSPRGDGGLLTDTVRRAFLPTLALGPVVVLIGAMLGGTRAAIGAALGFLVVVAFFALGQLVTNRLSAAVDSSHFVTGSVAVVVGQLAFLLLVIIVLGGAGWLDGTAFGLSALAVALAWQVFQVIAFLRGRRAVFDAIDKTRHDGTSAE